jgi:DNA polymerase I
MRTNAMHKPIYLFDASLYVFRAYHALSVDWHDREGWPTHAVYGFTRTLLEFLQQTRAEQIAVCFDRSFGQSLRHQLYPAYKANREPPTEELNRQFDACIEVCRVLGLSALFDQRYEADDLIASLAHKCTLGQRNAVIVSADKDLGQLLNQHVKQWDFGKGELFDAHAVLAKFGVEPKQMAELQALTGDAIDNIPGVPGVGPKTAAGLLQHFGSLDALLSRINEAEFLRSIRGAATAAAKIKQHREAIAISHRLTRLFIDAPTPDLPALQRQALKADDLDALFDRLGFGALLRNRAKRLAGLMS